MDETSRWRRRGAIGRRLLRLAFLLGVPLVLVPVLLPRRVSARRLSGRTGANTAARPAAASPGPGEPARLALIQDVVDRYRAQLGIPDVVTATIVPENKLVVSVERVKGQDGAFSLSLEAGFLEGLSDDELGAVVAHELGHVWIFTHHPFLQTEELANEVALRVVARETLDEVYKKVWTRVGAKGTLVYLPVD